MGIVGAGIMAAMTVPDLVTDTKEHTAKQRQRRLGTHMPGGAPPMRKISAAAGLRRSLEKTSDRKIEFTKALTSIPGALGLGAALTGGGLLAGGAAHGIVSAYQKMQAARMFKELQQRYPDIKRHKDARKYFDLIVAYAPSLMRHHAAIGDFLTRQLQYPMSSIEFIKQLADLEGVVAKTRSGGGPSQFGQNVGMSAAGFVGPMSEEAKKQ